MNRRVVATTTTTNVGAGVDRLHAQYFAGRNQSISVTLDDPGERIWGNFVDGYGTPLPQTDIVEGAEFPLN
jgi:hypothetical protein